MTKLCRRRIRLSVYPVPMAKLWRRLNPQADPYPKLSGPTVTKRTTTGTTIDHDGNKKITTSCAVKHREAQSTTPWNRRNEEKRTRNRQTLGSKHQLTERKCKRGPN